LRSVGIAPVALPLSDMIKLFAARYYQYKHPCRYGPQHEKCDNHRQNIGPLKNGNQRSTVNPDN